MPDLTTDAPRVRLTATDRANGHVRGVLTRYGASFALIGVNAAAARRFTDRGLASPRVLHNDVDGSVAALCVQPELGERYESIWLAMDAVEVHPPATSQPDPMPAGVESAELTAFQRCAAGFFGRHGIPVEARALDRLTGLDRWFTAVPVPPPLASLFAEITVVTQPLTATPVVQVWWMWVTVDGQSGRRYLGDLILGGTPQAWTAVDAPRGR